MRCAVVGRAGESTTRVSLNVDERRRERRGGFGDGDGSGSVDGAGEREEGEEEREGEGEKGEMYTGEGTRTGGTGMSSMREPNSVSVGVQTGVVTGTSLRWGNAY